MTAKTTLRATLMAAIVATIPAFASSAELHETPAAVLTAWAEAYAAQQGARTAGLYTPNAWIWDSASREQVAGQAAIRRHFDHHGLGAAAIGVRFGDHGLRAVAPDVAIVSGDCIFLTEKWDGSIESVPARFSMTLLRGTDGGWRIADQHTSFTPPAGR